VYFHKSADGEVIYVGKAAVLKNRVRQYFQSRKDMDSKTLALVSEIADTDWLETESEIDALFLESEMIKRYKPKWNILLRDDKSVTYVRINMRDDWPFVSYSRQPLDDGAEYIGPFYSGGTVKNALRLLRKVFPFYTARHSGLVPESNQSHGFRNKSGMTATSKLPRQIGLEPSVGTTSAEYKKSLRQLISYIKGNRVAVVKEIEKSMKIASRRQKFEQAAKYRNMLFNLSSLKKQIVFSREEFLDISKDQGLIGLRDLLNLENVPHRIEGYDISHISGTNNVASMVVFTNGVADKQNYRKFRLTQKNDDYAAMRETILRRLKHLKDWGRPDLVILDGGKGQLSAVADLLNAENIPFIGRDKSGDHSRNADVSIVVPGNTNNESRRTNNGKQQSAATRDSCVVILDSRSSHIAKLIARLDDEAHRFAISYHTSLRKKTQTKNELEQIPGIGPKTRKLLLKKFGSISKIKSANVEEIEKLIGPAKATLIKSTDQTILMYSK
jgi:excinuclease ABC subunit C